VKCFSVYRVSLCHLLPVLKGNRSIPMFALLIAVGALFLAVAVAAAIDPGPGRYEEIDEATIMDGIALSA